MQTYLFYDIETTGLNKAFDQVLHFAGIRTDSQLKELARYEIKIKLNSDIIPSPAAMITHQMSLADIATGLSEYEAIKQIHGWLNQPGTISVGYNTLGFDDEFLRFSFYRHLLSPYSHQWENNCGRMDIFPIAVMYFLFKKAALTWPQINGKTSLKLEHLNKANQLVNGRSHHAMVDVEITLALAKRFFQENEVWKYMTGYFNKKIDQERLQHLQNSIALLIHSKAGASQSYQCPVLFLGNHRHYKNQLLWLQLDSPTLSQTTAATIPETTIVTRKRLGEAPFILPERFLAQLLPERLTLAEENKKWLYHHPDIYEKIVNYHLEYKYPDFPETDIDASLYLNGFWSEEEKNICRTFHAATVAEKSQLIERIKNPTLHHLAIRLLGRHFPEALSTTQAALFNDYLKNLHSLIDYHGEKRLTVETALNEMNELRKQPLLTQKQLKLLEELELYLKRPSFVVS